jgi:hypothetical protein
MERSWTWLAWAVVAVGCGASEVGEECTEPGNPDECVEEAVCVRDDHGDVTCRRIARLGETCSNQGDQAECETSNLVCGKPDDAHVACLKVCLGQGDCAADQECNGVEGTSIKGCRPAK